MIINKINRIYRIKIFMISKITNNYITINKIKKIYYNHYQ